MKKLLVVIVNYGEEQLNYLQQVIDELKSFQKYKVTIVVHSNINLPNIKGIDLLNVIKMDDYEYLPMTCRQTIDQESDNFDYFIFTENDHLWKEHHIDKYIEYESILPKNRIAGLIQYEENETGRYYPAYHWIYDWDYNSIEEYNGKKFAHFTNIHQACFIISKEQLSKIKQNHDFTQFLAPDTQYSSKCRTNTDIYRYAGMKKLICISEFEDNLIHHLPNIYINGDKGRLKLNSDENKMQGALNKLLN
jgi:hypothetical protein